MSQDPWHCPDADKDGFVDTSFLRERAREGRESFLEEFPALALYVVAKGPTDEHTREDATRSGVQLLTMALKSMSALKYLGRVAFVAKRPGNAFAHLVSIGRSEKNDITVAVDSVSKVHGYFVREDDGWAFNDHNSTNGSFLDERRLVAGEKETLRSGAFLRLGMDLTIEVLAPADLYDRIAG